MATTLAGEGERSDDTALFFLPHMRLEVTEGPFAGRTFRVAGEGAILGRRGSVVLDTPTVSRHHAQILYLAGRFLLIDMGSQNGTYVNGQRVVDDVALDPNDTIVIAEHRMRVVLGEVADGEAAEAGPTATAASGEAPDVPGLFESPSGVAAAGDEEQVEVEVVEEEGEGEVEGEGAATEEGSAPDEDEGFEVIVDEPIADVAPPPLVRSAGWRAREALRLLAGDGGADEPTAVVVDMFGADFRTVAPPIDDVELPEAPSAVGVGERHVGALAATAERAQPANGSMPGHGGDPLPPIGDEDIDGMLARFDGAAAPPALPPPPRAATLAGVIDPPAASPTTALELDGASPRPGAADDFELVIDVQPPLSAKAAAAATARAQASGGGAPRRVWLQAALLVAACAGVIAAPRSGGTVAWSARPSETRSATETNLEAAAPLLPTELALSAPSMAAATSVAVPSRALTPSPVVAPPPVAASPPVGAPEPLRSAPPLHATSAPSVAASRAASSPLRAARATSPSDRLGDGDGIVTLYAQARVAYAAARRRHQAELLAAAPPPVLVESRKQVDDARRRVDVLSRLLATTRDR